MPEGLFEKYLGLWVLIFLFIVSLLFALIKEQMLPKEKRGADTPIAKIFKQVLMDFPSLLAFIVTAALIIMIFMNVSVPEVMSQAFTLIVGFYFGTLKKK